MRDRYRRNAALRSVGAVPRYLAVALLVLAVAALGCSGGGPAGSDDVAVTMGPTDPNALYLDFVECESLPPGVDYDPVEGLVMPQGMVVTAVSEVGPITQVTGFIDQTPVDVRDTYAEDAQLVYLEDEGYEAEILVDTGGFRTFIKASIRCRTGSVMALIVAPDDEAGGLPVPGQQTGN